MIAVYRWAQRAFWLAVPHRLRPESQFSYGVCRRCGVSKDGRHLKGVRR